MDEGDLCCQLLRAKNFPNKHFACCKGKKGSQFWMGVNKIREKMKWGCVSQVVSGDQTLFLEDVWIGQVPLKITFSKLYNCCKEKTPW
jgi:hypothetical protein